MKTNIFTRSHLAIYTLVAVLILSACNLGSSAPNTIAFSPTLMSQTEIAATTDAAVALAAAAGTTPTTTPPAAQNATSIPATATGNSTATITLVPTTTFPAPTGTAVITSADPRDHWVNPAPSCEPINNPDWLKAMGTDNKTYLVTPNDSAVYNLDHFRYFEGETLANPKKHTVKQITGEPFEVFSGNAWDCGVVTEKDAQNTILFESWAKKMQNEEIVSVFKDYLVFSPIRPEAFTFDSSTRVATVEIWPPTVPRVAVASDCPVQSMQLAFGLQGQTTQTIAVTNAACNILIVKGDKSAAMLYKGTDPLLDQYTLGYGDLVYIINPGLSADQIVEAVKPAVLTDYTK